MKSKRVFLYVQHLLGIGHLRRAATLANAMASKGLEVTLASGGGQVPGLELHAVRLVQLPAASAGDASFKSLAQADGTPVSEEWKSDRRELLLDAWRHADPHALILELYPFGRRQMRFELLPLLDAASKAAKRPMIVSSVRDVLGGGQNNPGRQDEMVETFERYFDRVLVHADPELIPFGLTFRHADRIGPKLHYTGYVVDRPHSLDARMTDPDPVDKGEVLVSAGGGAVGMRLLETAIRARPHSKLAHRTWRVLAGVNASNASMHALTALADNLGEGRVRVERARPDFTSMLASCAVSVSQGGYNTIMEIVHARARAVVVPFAGGAETEQALRARAFAAKGLLEVLEEDALTPGTLAVLVDRCAAGTRPAASAIDLGGAERSAELVKSWMTGLRW